MIYIFQQNPAGLHAPKFRILKKKKVVHPPSVNHLFESDINLIGSDMILFRFYLIFLSLIYQIHNLSVLLVAVLTNSGVKKQGPQVSFKTAAGDLI